jgi:sugar lactone lactonase YvrE
MLKNIRVLEGSQNSTLGETPVYSPFNKSVFWVDILEKKAFQFKVEDESVDVIELPFLASAFLPTSKENVFLVTSDEGIFLFDLVSREVIKKIAEFPEKYTRPNEAAICPKGDLYFGTMGFNAEAEAGSWYHLEAITYQLTLLEEKVSIPNTLVFEGDNVIFGDTAKKEMYTVSLTTRNWGKDKKLFMKIPEGGADGSFLCGNGVLINARWGHSKIAVHELSRINKLDFKSFKLPVTNPSSCCLVEGKNGPLLFITSARLRLENPHEIDGKVILADVDFQVPATSNLFKI